MPKRSWRTTAAGVTLIASTLTAVAGVTPLMPESWRPWLVLAGAVGGGLSAGLGLIAARDNTVSSQDVGVRK